MVTDVTILICRLLREMGWTDTDEDDYEITEEEMKAFYDDLSKQVTNETWLAILQIHEGWKLGAIATQDQPICRFPIAMI